MEQKKSAKIMSYADVVKVQRRRAVKADAKKSKLLAKRIQDAPSETPNKEIAGAVLQRIDDGLEALQPLVRTVQSHRETSLPRKTLLCVLLACCPMSYASSACESSARAHLDFLLGEGNGQRTRLMYIMCDVR